MTTSQWSPATRQHLPLILIRGYAGLTTDTARQASYQGFEEGTVYPHLRGPDYIYEGLLLRLIKSDWQYYDAVNVIGYYPEVVKTVAPIPADLEALPKDLFCGHKIILDPTMALRLLNCPDPSRTIWVFRYYDLLDRQFTTYGEALYRVIEMIRALITLKTQTPPKINIIAHSMGGLIVREAVQRAFPDHGQTADAAINKIVTLGTPHKGISPQVFRNFDWLPFEAADEMEHLNYQNQTDPENPSAAIHFHKHFPLERLFTVVGTNYRAYPDRLPVFNNHWLSAPNEYGLNYNRSDGLVKQAYAQIEGAPRTFLHNPHSGNDSLSNGRSSYEVAIRFLFGNVRVRLRLVQAKITQGFDRIGQSEFFHGVTIKPRGVDFELFHQSVEAENCFGPCHQADLNDDPAQVTFAWSGPDRMIWEGYLHTEFCAHTADLVMRLDFYVGERDLHGLNFSDTLIFRQQYFVQAVLEPQLQLYICSHLPTAGSISQGEPMRAVAAGWEFDVASSGYLGTYRIEFDTVPETGSPQPFR